VAMLVMWAVNLTGTLRVSEEGELYGLDLHEHGISAYPEYQISPFAAPGGMVQHPIASPSASFSKAASHSD
jgi:ammonium transporter, Amt family